MSLLNFVPEFVNVVMNNVVISVTGFTAFPPFLGSQLVVFLLICLTLDMYIVL